MKLVHKRRNFISNQSSDQRARESELLSFYYTLEQPNKIRRYQRFESATPFEQRRAVRAGVEADDRGRWAVRGIRAVRRHEGRRGRPLDVLVEWEGEDSDGDLWEESWISVTE